MNLGLQLGLAMIFTVHAVTMLFDEFYFHVGRGLEKWERLGHPLDTLTVWLCFWLPRHLAFARPGWIAVGTLSVLSCLFVTKDEWVHSQHCRAAEHWLHAVLFTLHPLILASNAVLWYFENEGDPIASNLRLAILTILGIFGLYQLIFWNFIWTSPRQTPAK